MSILEALINSVEKLRARLFRPNALAEPSYGIGRTRDTFNDDGALGGLVVTWTLASDGPRPNPRF